MEFPIPEKSTALRTFFQVLLLGSLIHIGVFSWLGHEGSALWGLGIGMGIFLAGLAVLLERFTRPLHPFAPLVVGSGLALLSAAGIALSLPPHVDHAGILERLRNQAMLATVGKDPESFVIDQRRFGPYGDAARYVVEGAKPLAQAVRIFRGSEMLLNHTLDPRNWETEAGRQATRNEVQKVSASLADLRAIAMPLIGEGFIPALRAKGISAEVCQALARDWKGNSQFSSFWKLLDNQEALAKAGRSLLDNLDPRWVRFTGPRTFQFTDSGKFARHQELIARLQELSREEERLIRATTIHISDRN